MNQKWVVYMLECEDGSFYAGITTDIDRRIEEHKSGEGSSYTAARGVKSVAHTEAVADRSTASSREAAIKKLSHEQKQQLANGN